MGFIYKIENLINHKVYIGLTTRNNPEKRFHEHLKAANNKPYLIYQAMRKYGTENFSFDVIEEVNNDELNMREIYWIAQYDSYNNGYNMTPGGKAPKKEKYCKISDEQILDCYFNKANQNGAQTARLLKISDRTVYERLKEYNIKTRNRNQIISDNNKMRSKPIWQINMTNLQVIHEFLGVWEIVPQYGQISSAIEARKDKSAHGYFWCYANQESYELLLSKIKNFNINKHKQFPVQQIDPKNNEVINTFSSIKEATFALGHHRTTSISDAINGRAKTAYGFIWRKIID